MLLGSAMWLTCWNITTYGVSLCSRSLYAATSLQSFDEDSGAMYVVYDDGIEIPSAGDKNDAFENMLQERQN
jgi:hypothetical protein